MLGSDHKTSFLGAISPWSTPRSSTPQPVVPPGIHGKDVLQRSDGEDHTVSHTHRISIRQYPKDCPPLRVRWFYAVDSPKRKPTFSDFLKDAKPPPSPRKFVPFTFKDSQAIERGFQKLCDLEDAREDGQTKQYQANGQEAPTRVAVNEDYLFDVDVEQRELMPAYWLGPVYEVVRGTWFYQEGSSLRPCQENLATQLEEGFLKMKPWLSQENPKRPTAYDAHNPADGTPVDLSSTTVQEPMQYRLFGAYMNTTVTYQDSSMAWLNHSGFISRVSTTVYQKFGGVGGTKVVRGFTESERSKRVAENKAADMRSGDSYHSRNPSSSNASMDSSRHTKEKLGPDSRRSRSPSPSAGENISQRGPRPMLERQISSLAGEPQDTAELEEQARQEEQREMEDLREGDEERDREIDHLILVTHGIGQRLGLRLDTIHFIQDVNTLRKTLKNVYKNSPDLQALNSKFPDSDRNCRVQVLPVCWRYLLDFPYRGYRQHRKESDIAEVDHQDEDRYPNLADITLEGVPSVRNLISDLAMDVLLYQSDYREHIVRIVQQECNRIFKLFKTRNPNFKGSVSLCGHSLGSAIFFDILCDQQIRPSTVRQKSKMMPSGKTSVFSQDIGDLNLDFECEEFFCLGSPLGLFQMIKGKTIAGRSTLGPNAMTEALDKSAGTGMRGPLDLPSHRRCTRAESTVDQIPLHVSSPKCQQLYNIFHPSDPVSYRIEPLVSPAMAKLKPQPLPWVKRSLWAVPGQSFSLIGSRVGSLFTNFTSGVASSLLSRSLGLTSEDASTQSSTGTKGQPSRGPSGPVAATTPLEELENQMNLGVPPQTLIQPELETLYSGFHKARTSHSQPDSEGKTGPAEAEEVTAKKLRAEDAKVRALNSNGRLDYSVQESAFDISLIASIASHLSYWSDEDVNHFMLSQMLSRRSMHRKLTEPKV